MELIKLSHENIDNEHICCAISNNKDIQVMSKKMWLSERLDEGLVFLKGNVRGKCFIEYIPAENAWVSVDATDFMFVDCLWVSGQFKGKGYSNILLDECIRDSKEKGKKGLVTISSKKKRGFLADEKYLMYKGFRLADTAEPYFELMYLPFEESVVKPQFGKLLKAKHENDDSGFCLYYSNQCPFTAKYVPIIEKMAKEKNVSFKSVHIVSKEQARSVPCAFTTYALFYNGEFITHEILSEKKFEKILLEKS